MARRTNKTEWLQYRCPCDLKKQWHKIVEDARDVGLSVEDLLTNALLPAMESVLPELRELALRHKLPRVNDACRVSARVTAKTKERWGLLAKRAEMYRIPIAVLVYYAWPLFEKTARAMIEERRKSMEVEVGRIRWLLPIREQAY